MNRIRTITSALAVAGVACAAAVATLSIAGDDEAPNQKQDPVEPASEPSSPGEADAPAVSRTDEEWRKLLTPEQFEVTRKAGTERPWGKAYDVFKKQGEGTYYCVACGAELFTSSTKFDSRCGWPSFYDPSKAKNVKTKTDYKIGYARTEVLCSRCDAHLGHVFTGEGFDTPTDKRYCINAIALKFVEKGEPAPELLPASPGEGKEEDDDG